MPSNECAETPPTEGPVITAPSDDAALRATDATICARVRRALSPTPREATPLRWSIIIIVLFSLFSCVVNITLLFPYLPQMIRDLGYMEQEIGYYSGTVASSYFVGAFLSSNIWGFLTDRWGRRPVMLICIFGTGVCTLAFGFSSNIYWAFLSRFLVGVFNGIIGTTKAILGDISDNTNQALGLALLSVGWASGLLLGPSIGGYLSEPAKKYPQTFSDKGLFATYPYFLPNLLSGLLCFAIFSVCLTRLPETRFFRARDEEDEVFVSERELAGRRRPSASAAHAKITAGSAAGNSAPLPPPPYRPSKEEPDDGKAERVPLLTPPVVVQPPSLCDKFRSVVCNRRVVMATMLFSIFGFACVALDETIALWAATMQIYGGLGFSTNQLGTMTGALNIPCLVMNIFVFPRLERQFGSVRTYCVGAFVLVITTGLIPFISNLAKNSVFLWIVLVIVLVPNRMMYPICWSAADILINNSVFPEHLGLVNGLSMTFSFLARSASPLAAGSIFSWSISTGVGFGFPMTHHLVFFVIDLTMMVCFVIGVFTPRSLDKQPETWTRPHGEAEVVSATAGRRSSLPTPRPPSYASYEDAMRQRRLLRASLSGSLAYSGPPLSILADV